MKLITGIASIIAATICWMACLGLLVYCHELTHQQSCKYLGGSSTFSVDFGGFHTNCAGLTPEATDVFMASGAYADISQYPFGVLLTGGYLFTLVLIGMFYFGVRES